MRMTIATPPGYEPRPDVLEWARQHETDAGIACRVTSIPEEAVNETDVIYTDAWISMGQETEAEVRRRAFTGFQVTEHLFRHAGADAVIMHCLPAHRGEEVAPDVIDSRRSIVFRQAENRLHTEKALLLALMRSMAQCAAPAAVAERARAKATRVLRHGLEDIVDQLRLAPYPIAVRRLPSETRHSSRPERRRMVLEERGPS